MRRGLAIDPEVVEVDARFGIDAERLAHHQVDSRVGFADAGLGAFDNVMEMAHDFARTRGALGIGGHARSLAMRHVVGDASDLEVLLAKQQRLHHARPHLAGEQR